MKLQVLASLRRAKQLWLPILTLSGCFQIQADIIRVDEIFGQDEKGCGFSSYRLQEIDELGVPVGLPGDLITESEFCPEEKCEEEKNSAGQPSAGQAEFCQSCADQAALNQSEWDWFNDKDWADPESQSSVTLIGPDGESIDDHDWLNLTVDAAGVFGPQLSLGHSTAGTSLVFLAVEPDLNSAAAINAPITVTDIRPMLSQDLGTLQTTPKSGSYSAVDPDTGLTRPYMIQQYATVNCIILLVEQPDKTLKVYSVTSQDYTAVQWTAMLAQTAAGNLTVLQAAAETSLTVRRSSVAGMNKVSMEGRYNGMPYSSSTGIYADASGKLRESSENGSRSQMVETFLPDAQDLRDGMARVRSIAEYRQDPQTKSWVLTSSRMMRSRTLFAGREIIVEEEVTGRTMEAGVAAAQSLRTQYTYDENEFLMGKPNRAYGKVTSVTYPDGSWARYEFDPQGRLYRTFKPWLNSPATVAEASATNCKVETRSYFPEDNYGVSENWTEVRINGVQVAREETEVKDTGVGTFEIKTLGQRYRLNSSSGAVETYTETESNEYLSLPEKRRRKIRSTDAAGIQTRYEQVNGVLASNGSFTPAVTGKHTARFIWGPISADSEAIAGVTVKTMEVTDAAGLKVHESHAAARVGGPYLSVQYTDFGGNKFVYDSLNRLTNRISLLKQSGDIYTYQVTTNPAGVNRTLKAADGSVSTTQFDQDGQVIGTTLVGGVMAHPVQYQQLGYAPTYRETKQLTVHPSLAGTVMEINSRSDSGGTGVLSNALITDSAGRTVRESERGVVTDHGYDFGGRWHQETEPGGLTKVTLRFKDGQIQSVTGNRQVQSHHSYSINPNGTITETVFRGSVNSARWRSYTRDYQGNLLFESSPSPVLSSQTVTIKYYHDNAGRLVRVQRPGLADELFKWDDAGARRLRGVDMNGNGVLETGGTSSSGSLDQVVESGSQIYFELSYGSGPAGEEVEIYTPKKMVFERIFTGSSGLPFNSTIESSSYSKLSGSLDVDETAYFPGGQRSRKEWNESNSTGQYRRVIESDSEGNSSDQRILRGLPAIKTTSDGRITSFRFNAHGQLLQNKRTLASSAAVVEEDRTFAYAPDGLLTDHTAIGEGLTTNVYYPSAEAHSGKLKRTIHDNSTPGILGDDKITDYAYNLRGELTGMEGTGALPEERDYNAFGELKTLTMRRSGVAAPDVTTWDYQPATGLLVSKTDPLGRKVSFTYDIAGRMKTRTDGRNIVTTYSYDGAGRMTSVDYSDTTPDVSLTYDRAGRLIQVQDATGTRALGYIAQGFPSMTANQFSWSSSSLLPNWTFSLLPKGFQANVSDQAAGGWQLSGPQFQKRLRHYINSGAVQLTDGRVDRFAFDTTGAWTSCEVHTSPSISSRLAPGSVSYQAGTVNLISQPDRTGVITGSPRPTLNWLWRTAGTESSLESVQPIIRLQTDRWGYGSTQRQGQSIVRGTGPRQVITTPDYQKDAETRFSYNQRNEVATAQRLSGGVLKPGGAARFQYDDAGNRLSTSLSTPAATLSQVQSGTEPKQTTDYTPNALNQYASIARQNPLLKLVQGVMNTESTVTISAQTGASWQTVASFGPGAASFTAGLSEDVSAGPHWKKMRVQAQRLYVPPVVGTPPPTPAPGTLVTAQREGWLYFPPATESLAYDLDGNLTADARWLYTWDAENRLSAMEEKATASAGPARQRLEFTYDYEGRRVRKLVRTALGDVATLAATRWPVTKDRRFIYDGWNMIAELDATPQPGSTVSSRLVVFRSYVWGKDISGTEQGAGGVGGLLMMEERDLAAARSLIQLPTNHPNYKSPKTYAPCYDFNGNIIAYVELNTRKEVTHHFEYDAFGQELSRDTLVPTGIPAPEAPPLRFSTKYHDEETGLAYYGHRYYNSELGRWLNRDPIGEKGGNNLYGMVGNDAVNKVDVLGLACTSTGVENCRVSLSSYPWTHEFIKIDGTSYGFYAGSNSLWDQVFGTPGVINTPDPHEGNSNTSCAVMKLDPDCYDITKFQSCVRSKLPSRSSISGSYNACHTCVDWVWDDVFQACRAEAYKPGPNCDKCKASPGAGNSPYQNGFCHE